MAPVRLAPDDVARASAILARIYQPANRRRSGGVHVPTTIPAGDLAWLAARGLTPDQRTSVAHDRLVTAVRGARRTRTIAAGAAAFVASLDGGGPPHGAYLEAALLAHRLPAHRHDRGRGGSDICRVCGLDAVTVRDHAEEFLDWHVTGTGIPGDLAWAALALERWPRGAAARPSPAAQARLARILVALDELPAKARAGAAVAAVHALGGFGGRRDHQARGIVETLGFAGVLEAPPHVGLATRFVTFVERDARPTVRTEYDAPLGFWRGAHGVRWANALALFGLDRAAARRRAAPAKPAPAKPAPAKPAARSAPARSSPTSRLARRPARGGDVWGVRLREDAWVMAYVWEVAERGPRPYARVEYLDWFGPTPSADLATATRGVRGRRDGRWQTWASGLDQTTGLVLLAESVAAPTVTAAEPTRVPAGGGKDVVYLADWCFPELDRP